MTTLTQPPKEVTVEGVVVKAIIAGFGGSAAAGVTAFLAVDALLDGISGSLADFGAIGALILVARFAYKALTSLSGTLQRGLTEADVRAANAEIRASEAETALREAREEITRLRSILLLHNLDPDEGAI